MFILKPFLYQYVYAITKLFWSQEDRLEYISLP